MCVEGGAFIFFVKGDSGSKTMPEFLTESFGRMVLPLEFKDVLISRLPAVSHLNFTLSVLKFFAVILCFCSSHKFLDFYSSCSRHCSKRNSHCVFRSRAPTIYFN